MGLRIWFCFLFIFTICLVTGCKESTAPIEPGISVSDVNLPDIVMESGNTEYSMVIIKPEPDINYKILQKVPDPNEGHAMLYVRPEKVQPEFKLDHKRENGGKESHPEENSTFVLP